MHSAASPDTQVLAWAPVRATAWRLLTAAALSSCRVAVGFIYENYGQRHGRCDMCVKRTRGGVSSPSPALALSPTSYKTAQTAAELRENRSLQAAVSSRGIGSALAGEPVPTTGCRQGVDQASPEDWGGLVQAGRAECGSRTRRGWGGLGKSDPACVALTWAGCLPLCAAPRGRSSCISP